MSWVQEQPAKMPPEPKDCSVEHVLAEGQRAKEQGQRSPALQYLVDHFPKLEQDTWGETLPLSDVAQDQANRLFALMAVELYSGRGPSSARRSTCC